MWQGCRLFTSGSFHYDSEFCFWDLRFGRIAFFRAYRPIGFFGKGIVDYFGEGMVVFWGDVAVVLIILCTFVAKLQI